jgi:hypothetical protein
LIFYSFLESYKAGIKNKKQLWNELKSYYYGSIATGKSIRYKQQNKKIIVHL